MNRSTSSQRSKRFLWILIVTPALTFLFGVYGNKMLEIMAINKLFSTETKAILSGLFVIGSVLVILTFVIIAFIRHIYNKEQLWYLAIGEIKDLIGTPAELLFEPRFQNRGIWLYRLAELIRQASIDDEILMMAYYGPKKFVESPSETKEYIQARNQYLQALLEKSKEYGIAYRRIMCFDESKICIEHLQETMEDHCREMLKIKETKPDKISLKVSSVVFPANILIIGKKTAAIGIDVYDPQNDLMHTEGVLIFHNPPNGQIIELLRTWFMEADSRSESLDKL